MPTILEEIVAHKKQELQQRKTEAPLPQLEQRPLMQRPTLSLREALQSGKSSGIIAEFKRRSPSQGLINGHSTPLEVTQAYEAAGASGLSILTDAQYFGGMAADIEAVREQRHLPILRKEFMVDPYQVVEARSIGADVILLIAAALSPEETRKLAQEAHRWELEVLLEVHNLEEAQTHMNEFVDMVGVNNRNLATFEVSLEHSFAVADYLSKDLVKISESGLSKPENLIKLGKAGFVGFLMGQRFMEEENPGAACKRFITAYQSLKENSFRHEA